MKTILKRTAVLALAVILFVTMTACAAYVDIVDGFLDAATYMSGEQNIRSDTRITAGISEDAQPVSFAKFINAVAASDVSFLSDVEMGLSIAFEKYEETAQFALTWIGENETQETLLTAIIVDNVIYVGLELLRFVGEIDEFAQFAPIMTMFNFDYIAIDLDYLFELLEIEPDELYGTGDYSGVEVIIRSAADKLRDAMLNYTPQVLTREVLSKDGDTYTLTLDAESAIQLVAEVLSIAAQNEDAVKSFIFEVLSEVTVLLDDVEMPSEIIEYLEEADFAEIADEFNSAVKEKSEEIPDFDFALSVSGVGSGVDMKQTSIVSFAMSDLEKHGAPFNMLTFEVASVTTVTQEPVSAPTGNTVSLEDLIALIDMFL